MQFATIESISPAAIPSEFPIRLEQSPSSASTVLKLIVLLPATVALLLPFLMVAKSLAADPAVRAVIHAKPAALLQIACGLGFWAVLFAWPLKRLAESLSCRRSVDIGDREVTITERRLFGTRTWTAPLSSYSGVIHHVRSSLSGLRRELILVHQDRRNSILLAIADRFAQSEIDRVSALLGQREVPARVIYTLNVRRTRPNLAVPAMPLARAA